MLTWDTLFLENPLSSWLSGLGVSLLIWAAVMLVRYVAIRRAVKAGRQNSLSYLLARSFQPMIIAVLALAAGRTFLTLPEKVLTILRSVEAFALTAQAGFWLAALIDYQTNQRLQSLPEEDLARKASLNTLRGVLKVAVWLLAGLIALDNLPNFNLSSIITSLGIGGIAIGLAAQNFIGDLLSSLTINLDKPFVVGDSIQVGTFSGRVMHIGVKSTRLMNLSGEELVISNSDLLGSRIQNFQRMTERRVVFTLKLDYATPVEALKRIPAILQEEIERVPNTRFSRAHFQAFGDVALQFEVVYFVTSPDYGDHVQAQHAINLAVLERFQREGLRFCQANQSVRLLDAQETYRLPEDRRAAGSNGAM